MQIACAVVSQPCCPTSPFEKVQEQELEKFMQSSKRLEHVVQNVHLKFFEIAPAGQEFFKESKTRMHALDMFAALLHCWLRDGSGLGWDAVETERLVLIMTRPFDNALPIGAPCPSRPSAHGRYHIAERTLELTLLIHREPKETVDQLSSLGLRHAAGTDWDLVKDSTILLHTAAHTHIYIYVIISIAPPKQMLKNVEKWLAGSWKRQLYVRSTFPGVPLFYLFRGWHMLLYNIIYTDLQLQQEGSGVGMYRSSHFISLLHQTDRGGFPFWLVFCHP